MSMKKLIIVIMCVFMITGCNSKVESNKVRTIKSDNTSNKEISSMKISIDNKEYVINLEDNETVKELIKVLPSEFSMNDLNGNEKYVYLNSKLPTNSSNVKYISVGDVMLYQDNCLVIFYKSFENSYSYTKIGHIDNLNDLNSGSVNIKIIK